MNFCYLLADGGSLKRVNDHVNKPLSWGYILSNVFFSSSLLTMVQMVQSKDKESDINARPTLLVPSNINTLFPFCNLLLIVWKRAKKRVTLWVYTNIKIPKPQRKILLLCKKTPYQTIICLHVSQWNCSRVFKSPVLRY